MGTKDGLDAIAFILRNQTSVIVGPSGVGKSSLINVLRSNHGGSIEDENWFEPVRFFFCLQLNFCLSYPHDLSFVLFRC